MLPSRVAGGEQVEMFHVTPTPRVRDLPLPLPTLVCPLSKKPLRYEEHTSQLINDELGIAYPVIDGIPNMIPEDARLIRKSQATHKEDSQK